VQETPQQYTERILGYIKGKAPIGILSKTSGQIARLIRGVSKKKLSQRPAPSTWSVTEILAHLADSEMVYGFRVRIILEASGTAIQGIDQDAWARFSNYSSHDPELSLEAFRSSRQRLVLLLKSLSPERWGCYGMHSERGKETVTRVVEMLAGHDINHLNQIRQRLPKNYVSAGRKRF